MSNDLNNQTETNEITVQNAPGSILIIPALILIGMFIFIGWRLASQASLHVESGSATHELEADSIENMSEKENHPAAPGDSQIFILIDQPKDGAVLAPSFTVSGTAAGLFEGNVVVQALKANGEVLAEKATTIDSPDAGIGGEGPWSVQLVSHVNADTSGFIYAFSPSPVDGSHMASSRIQVIYKTGE